MEVENLIAKEREDENLTQSQDFLNDEMDVDYDTTSEKNSVDRRLSRWDREQEIEKLMWLSDDELFGSEYQVSEQLKQSMRYRQRENNYFLAKSDQELFDIFSELSSYNRSTDEFKERHNRFVDT